MQKIKHSVRLTHYKLNTGGFVHMFKNILMQICLKLKIIYFWWGKNINGQWYHTNVKKLYQEMLKNKTDKN